MQSKQPLSGLDGAHQMVSQGARKKKGEVRLVLSVSIGVHPWFSTESFWLREAGRRGDPRRSKTANFKFQILNHRQDWGAPGALKWLSLSIVAIGRQAGNSGLNRKAGLKRFS